METMEDKSIFDLEKEILNKFRDFMTRFTKIDELGTAGSKLLSGFQQALEFIRKPPIDTSSKLVNSIIKANETERLKSYVNFEFKNRKDVNQNATNLGSCKHGLLLQIRQVKVVLDELEDIQANDDENTAFCHSGSTDVTTTKVKKNTDSTHLAALMVSIYGMVQQDYLMQDRIVSALDLNVSSEELESYCLMWSLRPFINDELVHEAWKYIH
ncbi:uncharacterized protein LOC127074991 isoform X3 [Lathyrus oleraceus]|uniref:DUF7795 domain-containing protein n=1 Tax=Pisum sativum TaxID=3888 RepID=A0A9D4XE67_PEA|nr:uncharacterized protein LOC127074991 isoform X3 [Pisum sativum]KAI5419384.1 hypothetical protein KIW84_043523 [Pisum sativum]